MEGGFDESTPAKKTPAEEETHPYKWRYKA
jgi:hypothetical protein